MPTTADWQLIWPIGEKAFNLNKKSEYYLLSLIFKIVSNQEKQSNQELYNRWES